MSPKAPFAPHFAAEAWDRLRKVPVPMNVSSWAGDSREPHVHAQSWPIMDQSLRQTSNAHQGVEVVIQVILYSSCLCAAT